ncbi:MAG TPA: hypothetical protein VNO14_12650 [Blastocatellia bacterium]|nr:hypothetical protein [Blastocatellia bacterium]
MNTRLDPNRRLAHRAAGLFVAVITLVFASTRLQAQEAFPAATGTCGGASISLPFTDVPGSNIFFCAIAEAFFTGLTSGTTATTYSPSANVNREQMAAFITRTLDQSLLRGSRRAVAQQWWQPTIDALRSTSVGGGNSPANIAWDGADIWVANIGNTVSRVRASDGRLLETWTGASGAFDILVATGRGFVTGLQGPGTPGRVYVIDPRQLAGAVTLLADAAGPSPSGLTFDGTNLWTANSNDGVSGGSITRITLSGLETTFTAGFTAPFHILWDGQNLWVADFGADQLKRVNPSNGQVLESIPVGDGPARILFDGTNLWVSNFNGDSVTVVRAVGNLRGTVLATLTGNGLVGPTGLAFGGERIMVVNFFGDRVSLFKAADFTPLGFQSVGAGTQPRGACSDGLSFWITRDGANDIVRF